MTKEADNGNGVKSVERIPASNEDVCNTIDQLLLEENFSEEGRRRLLEIKDKFTKSDDGPGYEAIKIYTGNSCEIEKKKTEGVIRFAKEVLSNNLDTLSGRQIIILGEVVGKEEKILKKIEKRMEKKEKKLKKLRRSK